MKLSLRNKTAILLIIFALILSASGIAMSNRVIGRMLDERYKASADELAATIAQVIDPEDVKSVRDDVFAIYDTIDNRVGSENWGSPEFDEYVSKFSDVEGTESFRRLLANLRKIQDVNDVSCIYTSVVDPDNGVMLYLVDAAYDDACPPGVFDPIYDFNSGILTDPQRGFPAYITNTEEYGWLVTAGAPVYSDDEVVGYAMVDVSMDMIKARQQTFTYTLIALQLAITLVITFIAISFIYRSVVKPVNKLSEAAAHYGEDGREFTYDEFAGLDIHTGDEIETLHKSMVKMEKDIDAYITSLTETREELSSTKQTADEMKTLANTDGLTGVRNKMSYNKAVYTLDQSISEGFTDFGIAMIDLNDLKKVNDTYGHEKGDKAIIKLCDTVCGSFKHSPVYRIGGDEFAVIIKNDDYDNIEETVQKFRNALSENADNESLEPYERVNAAIGWSLFSPGGDTCVEDVFRRADRLMYENKNKMKAKN